jgi:hypothetical protein
MTITFHCNFCNKKIDAKKEAAGKWGTCPSCHNKIYVPNLEAEDDLTLAPIDEEEERKKQQLMQETFMLEQEILEEREKGEQGQNAPAPTEPKPKPTHGAVDEDALYKQIVRYLRLMANGDLDKADAIARSFKMSSEATLKLLDRIALADIPEAELADVPPQVLAGLIRTLRSQIA